MYLFDSKFEAMFVFWVSGYEIERSMCVEI